MGHDHHHHAPSADADRRKLALALALTLGLVVAEAVAGVLADSVALLSDAGHNAGDAAAIGLAVVAANLAARPPSRTFTFGLSRAEVLSAQANGATLLLLAGLIGYDAVRRLFDPAPVDGGVVVLVGVLGAGANLAVAKVLASAERRSLNVEGAMAHVIADLWSSVAAVVAGVVVLTAGWERADPVAALVVVALMLLGAWRLLRDSGRVLLEGTPGGTDVESVGMALAEHARVVEVHDLHLWEVTAGFPALSAHVVVKSHQDCHEIRYELEALLHDRFEITHTTLQVEHEPSLLHIERKI